MADEAIEKPEVAEAPIAPPAEQVTPQETPPAEGGGGPEGGGLSEKLSEMERVITDLAERTRRAEHNASYFQALAEGKQEPVKPTQVEDKAFTEKDFWANPVGTIGGVVSKAFEQMEAKRKSEDEVRAKQDFVRKSQENYNTGWETASKSNPSIFKGIEDRVRQEMYTSLVQGQISPEHARRPEMWETAAKLVRLTSGELDLTKYYRKSPNAAPPVPTERPGPMVSPKEQPVLSEMEMDVARAIGQTPEQFIAAKKKLRDEEA